MALIGTVSVQTLGQASQTPGATVTIALGTGTSITNNNLFTWTAGEDETVVVTGTQTAGQEITFLITCDGSQRVITFGSGLAASGTFTLTASKVHTISFKSNGTTFYETSRITMA